MSWTVFIKDFLLTLNDRAYPILCNSVELIVEFFMSVGLGLLNLYVLYVLIGFLTYVLLSNCRKILPRRRVMFITAHPDDEVMFFGPSIMRLRETCDIYLLCLSYGDMYGKGKERKNELWASCKVLGIPASNIILFSHPELPDDPDIMWNVKKVYGCLYSQIDAYNIEEVYTFDIGGVSGHLNHISIFYAFARMSLKKRVPPYCKIFLLDTVNIFHKYSACFDASIVFFPFYERLYLAKFSETRILWKAMGAHQSQLVWFRNLYIYFSRYMYTNTYRELNQDDVELVLQMNEFNYRHHGL